jgi:hypothetical protein
LPSEIYSTSELLALLEPLGRRSGETVQEARTLPAYGGTGVLQEFLP